MTFRTPCQTPGIDPAVALPDLGSGRLPAAPFHEPRQAALEWSRLWRRVWNPGPRLQELARPGDFVVHDLGRESFLFTRDSAGELHGFYNVCQHRGTRLETRPSGSGARFFRCPFHGWSWNPDGSIKGVPDPETFPQFRNGLPREELGLAPLRIATWGGWLWFNLDGNAPPLAEFLGVLPAHLAPYRLDDMVLYEYKTFLWDCNWKVAVDAFNESYHFRALHPQMLRWANARAQIELLGEHSRMINQYGTTSAPYREADELYPELRQWMSYYGMDADSYSGPVRDVRLAKQAWSRQIQAQFPFLPYPELTDEQLSDVYHYFFFPGMAMNVFAEGINAFRYRPHESDPQRMYYDLIMLVHAPPGETPHCERRYFDCPVRYQDITDNPVGPLVTDVLQQDADNVARVQAGVQSEGFRGACLGDQELRLRHFHQVLERYLAEPGATP